MTESVFAPPGAPDFSTRPEFAPAQSPSRLSSGACPVVESGSEPDCGNATRVGLVVCSEAACLAGDTSLPPMVRAEVARALLTELARSLARMALDMHSCSVTPTEPEV